ncbi:hypothetical protein M4J07_001717, partial [Streptomyces longispororuber]|nr:hypothetical protein [Streptomyces longispororuber]
IPLAEDTGIPLEHGIEIRFFPSTDTAHTYRNGDYWIFPARRTLANVIWPYPHGSPPHGVPYHYAPLALLTGNTVSPLRTTFAVPLTSDV